MGEGSRVTGHAFVSYVREDALRVDQLQRMLTAAGIPVWRDKASLWPGDDWRAKIRDAIRGDALVFLACFSEASIGRSRSFQNAELELAIEEFQQRRPGVPWLIPVRFDECNIPDWDIGGGRSLASIQGADVFDDNFVEGATRLVVVVLRLLEHPAYAIHGSAHDTGTAWADPLRAEPEETISAPSSSRPKGLRHKLGFHRGHWEYDRPGSCKQTKKCTGCAKVMHRTSHQFRAWQWVEPRRENSCLKTSTCERCGATSKEHEHGMSWVYLQEANIGTNRILYKMAQEFSKEPCRQTSICPHCGEARGGTRTLHEWQTSSQHKTGNSGTQTCARCGATNSQQGNLVPVLIDRHRSDSM